MFRPGLLVGEGPSDLAVLRRLASTIGIDLTDAAEVDAGGQVEFGRRMPKYISAARTGGLHVLALGDSERRCPVELLAEWSGGRSVPAGFVVRLAVPMLESWLLADRQAIARSLRVAVSEVPERPDELRHPKQRLGQLAARSSNRQIATAVGAPREGGVVGPQYTLWVREYVQQWNVANARGQSPSLDRAARRLEALGAGGAV